MSAGLIIAATLLLLIHAPAVWLIVRAVRQPMEDGA